MIHAEHFTFSPLNPAIPGGPGLPCGVGWEEQWPTSVRKLLIWHLSRQLIKNKTSLQLTTLVGTGISVAKGVVK